MSACPICGGCRPVDTGNGQFIACFECRFALKRVPPPRDW